jgi:hypothetical protein
MTRDERLTAVLNGLGKMLMAAAGLALLGYLLLAAKAA